MSCAHACVASFLALALAACTSTSGPAYERATRAPSLSAASLVLQLSDARPAVDGDEFSVSAMTLGFQEQELSPPLDPALEGILQRTLSDRLSPGTRALRVDVTVREASAGWEANALSETEHARARLDVSVWDAGAKRLLVSGTGESWGKRSSLDTSASAVQKVLASVLREALFSFLAGPECRQALAP